MRGILPQIIVPPVVAGLFGFIGYLLGYPPAGIVAGLLLGLVLAVRTGRDTQRRLALFRTLTSDDAHNAAENRPRSDEPDEIDEAYSLVARRLRELEEAHASELGTLSRQSQLLDRMNDGIMRVDASGMVTYANVAASVLFRGRNLTGRSFIAVTRDHELSELVQHNLSTGEDRQHTFEIPGENSVFNAVITRLAESPSESLVVLRDITEVTRLQTLRRDFVANVSHDLRTPLSAIKIMTETLLELREDDPESQRFLGKIDDEVDIMTALVSDLLDLAGLEGRESRLSLRRVDIHDLIEDVRERMDPIASRHDVMLIVTIADGLTRLEADERRLNQVLVNLVNNAIVHTPAGGRVDIVAEDDGRDVAFEVRDTGTGIHPDDLPRVWERFFRVDRARSGRGTGLGLAIVKHVVLAHGGTIHAASEPGRGSEFRVTIPKIQGYNARPGKNNSP